MIASPNPKENSLRELYIAQLEELGYKGVKNQSLDKLASLLSQAKRIKKFKDINRDSSENAWFD